jgi:hypothetical protein
MDHFEIGPCLINYDRDATMDCYSRIAQGDSDICDCIYCRNFVLARDSVFPDEFLGLLIKLGIDYRKDAEVYQFCQMENGLHLYGGLFYFVGQMRSKPDSESDPHITLGPDSKRISFWIVNGRSLAQEEFGQQDLSEITFDVQVPWVLAEPDVE